MILFVKFSVKIYRYVPYGLILSVSDMLKILSAKVRDHFLNELAFVTNRCLAHDAFRKIPRAIKKIPKYITVRK